MEVPFPAICAAAHATGSVISGNSFFGLRPNVFNTDAFYNGVTLSGTLIETMKTKTNETKYQNLRMNQNSKIYRPPLPLSMLRFYLSLKMTTLEGGVGFVSLLLARIV